MKINLFKVLFGAVCIMFFAWFVVSYCDVIKHQNIGGTDAWWNLFIIMFGK